MIEVKTDSFMTNVKCEGDKDEIMMDLVLILKSVYGMFKEDHGEESARKSIALCGRLAFANGDDELKSIAEEYGIPIAEPEK